MIEDYAQPETIDGLDGLIELLRQDYQRLWLYTGENRTGKSTLALDVCQYVSRQLNSRIWISFFFNSYFGEREAINDIRQDLGLEKTNIWPASTEYAQVNGGLYDCQDIDEAVKSLHKGRSQAPEAHKFLVNYDIYGSRRYFYHLLMPEFEVIKGFRERRSHMHIDIPTRGIACFYKPTKKKTHKEFPDTPTWIEHFQPLDPEVEDIYRQVKDYMLRLSIKVSGGNKRDRNQEIALRMKEHLNLTQEDIAYCLDVAQSTVSRLITESNMQNP